MLCLVVMRRLSRYMLFLPLNSNSLINFDRNPQHYQILQPGELKLMREQQTRHGGWLTALWSVKATFSCLHHPSYGRRSWNRLTAWAMRGYRRHCRGYAHRSSSPMTPSWSESTSTAVLFVSSTRHNTFILPGFFNRCRFRPRYGLILPWISWRDSLRLVVNQWY
jgi:hypothetical protein